LQWQANYPGKKAWDFDENNIDGTGTIWDACCHKSQVVSE
jgi:hypothetical protein